MDIGTRLLDGNMSALPQEVQHDRSRFIGGSDTAAILGVSPWKSKFQLFQEKIGEFHEEVTPAKQKIFNRGKRWEPIVIEMLVDELEDRGHDVQIIARNERYLDPEHSFLAAEIDLELLLDGEHVNGEMKTVHPFAAKDWGEQDTDEIPIYYTSQVLHGQMVTGRSKTIVAALIGADDLRVHQVNRDDEMIQIIRNQEVWFWDSIQNLEPPEPTTLDDILRFYSRDSGEAMEANSELLDLIDELKAVKQEQKNNEAAETRLKVMIGKIVKTASVAIFNGKPVLTWKAQSTDRLDIEAIKKQAPGIYKQYLKTSDSRVLRLKK